MDYFIYYLLYFLTLQTLEITSLMNLNENLCQQQLEPSMMEDFVAS